MRRLLPLGLVPVLSLVLAVSPARAEEPTPAPTEEPARPSEKPAESAPGGSETEPAPEKPPSQEKPPAEGPPPSAPGESTPAPGERPGEQNWVDVSHKFVTQKLFAPIFKIDRFFSDERAIEAERSESFFRWRSQLRLAQDASRPSFTTGISANLRLPGLNEQLRRLRVVIEGETRDAVDALFPRQSAPVTPAEVATDEEAVGRGGNAGLRFYLWDTLTAHADLGGGFLLQLPPGVYARLRFRWAHPVGPLFLARAALIPFWRSDVQFGATGTLELDRPVGHWFLLKATGNATRSERSNGLEWLTELAAVVPLPPRSAAQIGVAWSGATAANVFATDPATGIYRSWQVPTLARTRAYTRLRSDVYRRWLYLEIEPEVAWPWSPERGRYSAWGLMFRVEIQFQGREAMPPPPPPPPPPSEPKDPDEDAPAEPPRTN